MTMFNITFLTPHDALLALVVALPVLAMLVAARRRRRVGSLLGVARLPFPLRYSAYLRALCVLAVSGSLAFALATPVTGTKRPFLVRTDAEVYIACDNSESMWAASSPGMPTRWDRLVAITKSIREALPGIRIGLACFTDRASLQLFPTADRDDFVNTIERAAAVNNPRPKNEHYASPATDPGAIAEITRSNFFASSAKKRVIVVITDGEFVTSWEWAKGLAQALKDGHVKMVLVHVWRSGERVFLRQANSGRYTPDPGYRADPRSRDLMTHLGHVAGAPLFDEHEAPSITDAVRSAIGKGPTIRVGEERILSPLSWFGWLGALFFGVLYLSTLVRFRHLR